MKKIISLLLCVALLCSMVVVAAHADDDGARMQVANVKAFAGTTVTVDLKVVNNPGLAGAKLTITDDDDLGVFSQENVENELLAIENATGLTLQDVSLWKGILVWYGNADETDSTLTLGTLTFTIPDSAEPGTYTFTVAPGTGSDVAKNAALEPVSIAATTFTVTVINEAEITGVHVAITTDLKLGIHVLTDDPDANTVTAIASLNVDADEDGEPDGYEPYFTVIDSYEEGTAPNEYIFYLNVKPWAMDTEFLFDLTENFVIGEEEGVDPDENIENDLLDLSAIPETADRISILQYCEELAGVLNGENEDDAKLLTLLADMLEYGRQAQIYNDREAKEPAASFELPASLASFASDTRTDFGAFCATNYKNGQTQKNSTAAGKFAFASADIEFGSTFVANINITKKGSTPLTNARVKVNGGAAQSVSSGVLVYEFSPMEVATGAVFDLYASSTTNNSNWAYTKTYGPAYFASYLWSTHGGDAAALLALLQGFYNYGLSVVAYMG